MSPVKSAAPRSALNSRVRDKASCNIVATIGDPIITSPDNNMLNPPRPIKNVDAENSIMKNPILATNATEREMISAMPIVEVSRQRMCVISWARIPAISR